MIQTSPLPLLCQIENTFPQSIFAHFANLQPPSERVLAQLMIYPAHVQQTKKSTNKLSHLSDFVTCDNACTASLSLLTMKGQTFHGGNDVFNVHPVSRDHGVVAIIRSCFSEAGCKNKTACAVEHAWTGAATRSSFSLEVEQFLDMVIQRVH